MTRSGVRKLLPQKFKNAVVKNVDVLAKLVFEDVLADTVGGLLLLL